MEKVKIPEGLHVTSKPVGSKCNLQCKYCFYLEKDNILKKEKGLMDDQILENYIDDYIKSQSTPIVEFVWHGGEPLLAGIDFFEKVIKIQKKYSEYKEIKNSLQTNGVLLDDKWGKFLKKNGFIVGISLDGPKDLHDKYRVTNNNEGSFEQTLTGLKILQKYDIEYNVLVCVTNEACTRGLEIYEFLKSNGIEFIQFTPLIEKIPTNTEDEKGYRLGTPLLLEGKSIELTEWSVIPELYGQFLIDIYEKWVREDVGKIFVMNFEAPLAQWFGNPSPNCIHARQCGKALALESDGSVYVCDHFVYNEYKVGNISGNSLKEISNISIKKGFGREKEEKLAKACKICPILNYCWGGCPKHRFVNREGEIFGHNYMCKGYKNFLLHIQKYLKGMAELLINGYPASYIMEAVKGPLILPKKEKNS
ncbi:MAG: anaerobic sulfatase maturase [Fusobacteriaceae bacterium]